MKGFQELNAEIAAITIKNSHRDVQVSFLLPFRDPFVNARERAFLTYLRDFWED